MTLERRGRGKNRQILLNGAVISPETLEAVCKRYFTAESWQELLQGLETHGKVYAALIFVNNDLRLQDKLDEANKKIAALERCVAELTVSYGIGR